MKIFVTGAAGYIGSVVTEQLINQGHQVVAYDNLNTGHRQAVHPNAYFIEGDILNADLLRNTLMNENVDAVFHLAAETLIGASNRDPGRSFRVNVSGGLNLLDAMVAANVKRMVFSSSAAVYGTPKQIPITESAPLIPINAYGESKLIFEQMLKWYRQAYGFCYICLRYFNVCGASEQRGEDREEETHIIPIAFEVVEGRRDYIHLYGTDYLTRDGTCIRDYIHVSDVAQAHLLALKNIEHLQACAYNLGSETGYTNREVLDTIQQLTGRRIKIIPAERRPGDPDSLVSSAKAISQELGWKPQYSNLTDMIESAWQWRLTHPQGYSL